MSLKIFEPFSVHTPADNPKGVLFAFSITSSIVLNVWIAKTGPKISSCTILCDWETFKNNVGGHQFPCFGREHFDWYISPPSFLPISIYLIKIKIF